MLLIIMLYDNKDHFYYHYKINNYHYCHYTFQDMIGYSLESMVLIKLPIKLGEIKNVKAEELKEKCHSDFKFQNC